MLIICLILILLIAGISDLRFQKIPNWLTYSTIMGGIIFHSVTMGLQGFLFSVTGVLVGIGLLIILYVMGGMGAGDVKLMGAVGGLLGPRGLFTAFLFTAIIGGIYAIALLILHGYLKETAKRYGKMIGTFISTRQFIYISRPKGENRPRLYYGVAIALGTFASLIWGIYM